MIKGSITIYLTRDLLEKFFYQETDEELFVIKTTLFDGKDSVGLHLSPAVLTVRVTTNGDLIGELIEGDESLYELLSSEEYDD